MCGIAGYIRIPGRESLAPEKQLPQMGDAIAHRGPDAAGYWWDDEIALVHRRLSILDLSDAGKQPMLSHSHRYVISYNGEVYNFGELKQSLEDKGHRFQTGTDTEVILELFEEEGPAFLEKLNGMFAIAIWDTHESTLFLARDRLGKKPLYVYDDGVNFAFASEIKSLLTLPFVKRDIRSDAIKDFFFYQYVPDPKSIYKYIRKVKPAHSMSYRGGCLEENCYWSLTFNQKLSSSPDDIAEELRHLIEDATRLRMVSDVPLGAFLSGGVDSSAIVSLMAGFSPIPIKTCAIGFDSEKYDEVHYARRVAEQFKTDHHEYTVKESVASSFTEIASYFDEPFADQSFVPTFYVAKLAKQDVTVALAGDGGDENFAGYSKYAVDQTENRIRQSIPASIRRHGLPWISRLTSKSHHPLLRKAASLSETLQKDPASAFFTTNSFFNQRVWEYLVKPEFERELQGYDPSLITTQAYGEAEADDHLSRLLYTDIKTFLPGDILTKVDRMTMANSLEARAPLLDYRVVEYAARIPSELKLRGSDKKHILKNSFKGILTDETLYRKKMGFSVPLAEWLRTELKPLGDSVFVKPAEGLCQYFDADKLKSLWEKHQAGINQFSLELWSLIAFEVWWRRYIADSPIVPSSTPAAISV